MLLTSDGETDKGMDFRTQRYFMTVAEELNFTRAAKRLGISQPPLSNTIRDLEEELGTALFVRGKRHLMLTDAGSLLMDRTAQILSLADRTREEVKALGKELSGCLHLSAVDGRASQLLTTWMAEFRALHPAVTFDLWKGSSAEAVRRLREGYSDLAIAECPFDSEHFEGTVLVREPYVAISGRDHPIAKKKGKEIPIRALAGTAILAPKDPARLQGIRKWFGDAGLEPEILCTLPSFEEACLLSAQGAGAAIFPMTREDAGADVAVRRIAEPYRAAEYVLLRERGGRAVPVAEAFHNFVEDAVHRKRSGKDPFAVAARNKLLLEA